MNKKILWLLAGAFVGYLTYEIVYLSSAAPYKYYCPTSSTLGQKDVPLSDPKHPNHQFQFINDVSCLNKTRVYDIVKVTSVDDIKNALKLAKEKKLHVSIAGVRHSMGGQAFFKDALVLDMTSFNAVVSLDEQKKTVTVQSGISWHNLQNFLNEKKLAIKAMQSTDIFTVGGSLAVNAHGMDHTVGALAQTVESFTLMNAQGIIQTVTPKNNPELFNLVIGGYGLFGIIVEVTLSVTDNAMYKQEINRISYQELPDFFTKIAQNNDYALFYAHLSTSPVTFFKHVVTYAYKKDHHFVGEFPELRKASLVKFKRLIINISKKRWYGQVLKWIAEKYIDPALARVLQKTHASRNEIMHDSVEYLENVMVDSTDILHEYYVPQNKLLEAIDGMKEILQKNNITVINASIRFVHKESIMLNYAPQDMFAIVLYLNQHIAPEQLQVMKKTTQQLIDLALSLGGSFFLPYQLYFTPEQLKKAYPQSDTFFALKKKYDPELIFMNHFYARYAQQ